MPPVALQPRQQPLQAPQPIAMPEVQGGQTYSSVNQNEYTDFIKQMMSFANQEGGFNIPLLDFLSVYFNKPDFQAYVLSPPEQTAGFMDQPQGLTFEQGKEVGQGLKSLVAGGDKKAQQQPGQAPPPALTPGQQPTPLPTPQPQRGREFKGYKPPVFMDKQFVPEYFYNTPNRSLNDRLPFTNKTTKMPSQGGPGADKWQKWLNELKQQGSSPGVSSQGY